MTVESFWIFFWAGCVFLYVILYKANHVVNYYSKFCYCFLFCSVQATIYMPLILLSPKDVRIRDGKVTTRVLGPLKYFLGLKYELRNTCYIAEDKCFIIVSNHQSIIDFLGIIQLWPIMKKFAVVSKQEAFYTGPFGLAAWRLGTIFIPRSNLERSKKILTERCITLKKQQTKLWMFSEGKRFNDGQIHPLKKGAFHLAINEQLPILPVVFSQYNFLDHKKKKFDQGKIIVTILPPISTQGKSVGDLESLLQETHQKMSTAFYEVNKELKCTQ